MKISGIKQLSAKCIKNNKGDLLKFISKKIPILNLLVKYILMKLILKKKKVGLSIKKSMYICCSIWRN